MKGINSRTKIAIKGAVILSGENKHCKIVYWEISNRIVIFSTGGWTGYYTECTSDWRII